MIELWQEFGADLQKHEVILIKDTPEKRRVWTIEGADVLSKIELVSRIQEALTELQKDNQ